MPNLETRPVEWIMICARGEFAFEPAANFRHVDTHLAYEYPVFGNLDDSAVHRCLNSAFHDQRVAIGNLCALQLDVRSYDQSADRLAGVDGLEVSALPRSAQLRSVRRCLWSVRSTAQDSVPPAFRCRRFARIGADLLLLGEAVEHGVLGC
jgi:hypothetical protein